MHYLRKFLLYPYDPSNGHFSSPCSHSPPCSLLPSPPHFILMLPCPTSPFVHIVWILTWFLLWDSYVCKMCVFMSTCISHTFSWALFLFALSYSNLLFHLYLSLSLFLNHLFVFSWETEGEWIHMGREVGRKWGGLMGTRLCNQNVLYENNIHSIKEK